MVKQIARLLILGATSCFLVACNGGDDDGGGGPNPTNTPGMSPTSTPQASPTNTPEGSPTNTPVGSPSETPEPTETETPEESPTPTSTPGGVLTGEQAVQAFASGLVTSLTRLGDLAGGGGAGSGSQISVPAPCSASGTVTVECVADGTGSETTFTFDECRNVNEEAQVDAFINGTIVQSTSDVGCFMPLPEDFTFLFISVIGDVDVSASGRNISGNLDVMLDILRFEDGTRDILLDALGTIDCVGEFEAFGDVILPADTVCPVNGTVDLTLPDGDSTISFFEGAVDLDYDNDGTPDDSVDSCEDSSLATCQ